jgi:hypothetical protein
VKNYKQDLNAELELVEEKKKEKKSKSSKKRTSKVGGGNDDIGTTGCKPQCQIF